MTQPHVPDFFVTDTEGTGGRIGPEFEDFQVDEVPAYEPVGTGDHWFVKVRKRGLTTPDAQRHIARAADVAPRDVGAAGMKDRRAVTTQWFSVPVTRTVPPSDWQLPDGLELVEASQHGNKLRTGQLRGNHFRIRLVDLEPGGVERAQSICERLAERGLPNFFGGQRFGRGGSNLAQALEWLEQGGRSRGKQRFRDKLMPSVLQSEVFNRYLSLRLKASLDVPLVGEVVRLAGTRRVFVVEDSEREAERVATRDIFLTGPMLGPKAAMSRAQARELEDEALDSLPLSRAMVDGWGKAAPGAFRDLMVFPEGLESEPAGPDEVWLKFFLPSGSYATQLIRELTRAEHLDAPRADTD